MISIIKDEKRQSQMFQKEIEMKQNNDDESDEDDEPKSGDIQEMETVNPELEHYNMLI